MQATEAVKIVLGRGETLSGRLLLYDAMTMCVNAGMESAHARARGGGYARARSRADVCCADRSLLVSMWT
eukprot:3695647-Pleurochrysis_carterae.AAC.1